MYPKDLLLGKIQRLLNCPGGFLTPLPAEGTARTGTSLVTARQFLIRGTYKEWPFVSPATSSDLKLSCDFSVLGPWVHGLVFFH